MLSPKMQRNVRVNDAQLIMLSERAQVDHSLSGYLHKRAADSGKWQQRWFILYQNMLFYYDTQANARPSGVVLLEGCYCERLITPPSGQGSKNAKDGMERQQYCFAVSYRRDNIRQYELRASSETDCKTWIEAIREASFNKVLMQKEELEQKHLHLLQIVESEKTAKWQYTQRCEELDSEIKKLRAELCALKKELRPEVCGMPTAQPAASAEGLGTPLDDSGETLELRKIKKVQSFFRGWLCRRRWKQIVEQYIKSPHAESMRKRNSLVFRMVEAEEEYMEQMEVLVSCFLRPFKMAASSKKPPCSHEDVNSIFLNTETVLFLHQIFLKGLTSRMESWPTLVLGDLFDMLLPMLSIYQEYVRNHHYSVQVLTECMKSPNFAALVHRLEEKPTCQGRSLATFLTYPMHQVPRYVTTLTDLLAHTPHDHVERKSLMNAQHQLEDLSRQMHDEVSETENLRKNLAVERMIVEGCDILLDVNQVFVRQGTLIQLPNDKRTSRSRLASFKSEKETVRQCFLFSNHLIIATRASNGRLHLVPNVGKIPLADAMLIEDPSDPGTTDDDESSICSMSSQSSGVSEASSRGNPSQWHNKDFKIVVDSVKTGSGSSATTGQISVHLLAPTMQEKAAWISDITQCMDNVHFNDLLHMSISDTSSVTMPQSIKNDPKLFKDDVDIRFSRTQVNSCKVHGLLVEGHQVPQIRYATPERLLERLTDLRFLSIDFLNTFLLTYRVFTDSVTVLEALKKVFYNADPPEFNTDGISILLEDQMSGMFEDRRRSSTATPRRTSGASSVSGYGSEMSDRSHSYDSQGFRWRANIRKFEEEHMRLRDGVNACGAQQQQQLPPQPSTPVRRVSIRVEHEADDTTHLTVPNGGAAPTTCSSSGSSDTLVGTAQAAPAPSSPSGLSTVTLVPSTSTSPTPSVQGSQSSSEPSADTVVNGEDKENDKENKEREKDKDEKEKGKENKNDKDAKKGKAKEKTNKDKDKQDKHAEENEKDSGRLGDRRPSASERRPSIIMTSASGRMERRLSYSERRPSADNTSTTSRRPSSAERRPSSCDRRLSSSERRSPRSQQPKRKGSDCGGGGGGGSNYGSSWKRDSITTDPWQSEDCQDTPRSSSARSASIASSALSYYSGGRRLTQDSTISIHSRPSIQHDLPQVSSKAGVVITSSRQSHRRCGVHACTPCTPCRASSMLNHFDSFQGAVQPLKRRRFKQNEQHVHGGGGLRHRHVGVQQPARPEPRHERHEQGVVLVRVGHGGAGLGARLLQGAAAQEGVRAVHRRHHARPQRAAPLGVQALAGLRPGPEAQEPDDPVPGGHHVQPQPAARRVQGGVAAAAPHHQGGGRELQGGPGRAALAAHVVEQGEHRVAVGARDRGADDVLGPPDLRVHLQRGVPGPGLDQDGQERQGAAHRGHDEAVQPDVRAGGERDRAPAQHLGARGRHREVGRRGRHRAVPAQLQRRAADLRRLQQQRRLPPQEDLGEGVQNDEADDRQAAGDRVVGRAVPQPARGAAPLRPALHPLPGHVPHRLVLHRGEHAQLLPRQAAQLLQDENDRARDPGGAQLSAGAVQDRARVQGHQLPAGPLARSGRGGDVPAVVGDRTARLATQRRQHRGHRQCHLQPPQVVPLHVARPVKGDKLSATSRQWHGLAAKGQLVMNPTIAVKIHCRIVKTLYLEAAMELRQSLSSFILNSDEIISC